MDCFADKFIILKKDIFMNFSLLKKLYFINFYIDLTDTSYHVVCGAQFDVIISKNSVF